jgi:hypothetical protein
MLVRSLIQLKIKFRYFQGGPTTMTEFKLVDVPDMNYTSKDIDPDTKKPTPRGKFYNII